MPEVLVLVILSVSEGSYKILRLAPLAQNDKIERRCGRRAVGDAGPYKVRGERAPLLFFPQRGKNGLADAGRPEKAVYKAKRTHFHASL